jgi:hypothetical protein
MVSPIVETRRSNAGNADECVKGSVVMRIGHDGMSVAAECRRRFRELLGIPADDDQ